ncbi:hypothetical protein L6452_36856 [Arctium lappa]|uniref:Uncharacterized protein n=1 Tax=Arctium lappa TaxID=4217 RepID=A0ACB8Y1G5_ARCLA|nr:hypothetical protein L6452_36856 [Arctium lappa]
MSAFGSIVELSCFHVPFYSSLHFLRREILGRHDRKSSFLAYDIIPPNVKWSSELTIGCVFSFFSLNSMMKWRYFANYGCGILGRWDNKYISIKDGDTVGVMLPEK